MYDKMSPDELFTQMLQIFKNPTDDFSRESQNMMPFKYYIQDLFRSLECLEDENPAGEGYWYCDECRGYSQEDKDFDFIVLCDNQKQMPFCCD